MKLLTVIVFIALLSGCTDNVGIDVKNCPLLSLSDTSFKTIFKKLENPINDSLIKGEFKITIREHIKYIKDEKNNWENGYSKDYFQIAVLSFNKEQVLIFCAYSGIVEGYKLFPHKSHDIYLLNRKNGSVIKHMTLQGGLGNALIDKEAIYIQLDSLEIHKYVFK
jgi:hypothetical protein